MSNLATCVPIAAGITLIVSHPFVSSTLSVEDLTRCLLYGDNTIKRDINHSILSATVTYIGSTKRFKKLEAFNEV